MKKKLSLLMIALLGIVGFVSAALDLTESTEATTTVLLTKENIEAQDYLSVTTNNWATNKTYGGVTGDFYNMSAADRQLSISVKGVSRFEVFVQNSNAGRSYTVKIGDAEAQTISHNGTGVESSGEIETGTADEVTITLAGDGSGSVYPVKIVLTKAVNGEPAIANPYTYTFENKVFDAKQQTKKLAGVNWTLDMTAEGDSYFGYDGTKGQQFGKAADPATALTLSTSEIPGTITKVKVNASGASGIDATMGVTVGDAIFQLAGDATTVTTTATLTKDATEYEFTGSSAGNIDITINNSSLKAVYIKSITVEYEASTTTGFRDIKVTLADADKWQALVANGATVYVTVAEDGTIGTTENADEAAATLTGKWHSTGYGWSNFTADVPVEGCVKITYATHDFGNDIFVTNDAGTQVAKFNTMGAKWSSDPSNVVVAYYRINEPTTLHFSNANYNPYFAVEAIDEADLPAEVTTYNITFDAGEGTGVAPAALEVNAGDKFNAPKNYTLYKEGATLTGWVDAHGIPYAVDAEITPEADMTLTALYTTNEVNLSDRTDAVTLTYPLSGYNDYPKYKFEGNTGIIVTQATVNGKSIDVKADVDATSGKFKYNGSGWHQVNVGTKVTVPSCKDATIAVTTYNDATSVTFNGEAGVADGNTATYTATAEDATIEISQVSNNYWNNLVITLPATSQGGGESTEYAYHDFEIDPLGDLLTADEKQQGTELNFGVVIAEDGTQTRVAADNQAANVVLSGTYHNDHGWRNFKAVVPVPGSVQITMSTCSWGGNVTVKDDATGKTVAEFTTQKGEGGSGCYGGNMGEDPNTVSAEYNGGATTLTISGGNYVNYFAIKKIEGGDEPETQDITATWDYANTDVMTETMALSGTTEAGEVNSIENTLKMTVEANGAAFRDNGGNIQVHSGAVFKIPVRNAGDLVTIKGFPGYSYYKINDGDEIQNTQDNPITEYKAKISDATQGYVAVTSTNDNNYYYSLSVVQYAPKEKITLDNEPATVTFPFNEGTEGQKATFSNADYFLSSKVTHGSNWFIKDKTTYAGTTETRLEPIEQHNDNLTDDDAISFIFTPKPGFTFTPTKVSFKANRFGTDNGLIDAYWQNVDGTTVELEKGIKPERNNTNLTTFKEYEFTSATPGEGSCGLKLFLYHMQATKQIGLADIVIEGLLNGTEKDVPVLASFKINGNEYAVEDVFGEAYEATLELPKAEQMVGPNNPLTDVTATSGEIGEITYQEKENACTVTIPMTAGETQMDYVLNVVFKPDFTLSYLDVEGNVLTTQNVEKDATIGQFAYDIDQVPATKEGYKARGWFKTAVLGEKFTTADVITANTNLYAIQTEIEEASTHKKYFFDLADKNFYPEDHEAFNPTGGYYWHDAQHGYAFKNGDLVDLLVGPKATITVTLCQYGSGTGIVVKKGEEVLETLPGVAEGDGGTAVYNYEGEPGTLTLEMQCGGEMYIHAMKIVNTAEVNYESEGNWYFVKAGNGGSLIDVIDAVNGINASTDAERAFIFLPDGTYDLDATVKTAITGHNISIIGQSMDKTIIVTKPDKSIEGLGKADLFDVSGTNLYMQDLTLQNALDYYNAGSAGRAAVLQDAGNRTIGKNVRMLSYQDTYYSSNNSQQAYWETCDIHGTVDFICGGGDIRFQNTTISLEPRKTDGTGGRTIVAPTTTTQFGYVFDGCTVVDLANGQGDWNFGRTWQNEPVTVYLNTTLDDHAKSTLVASRWTQKGMNNKDPKLFGEYGTKDAEGNDITPATNKIVSFGGEFETILTAEQAANFAYDKMFTNWDPAQQTVQVEAPAAELKDGVISWTPANNGAVAYMIEKNGEFVGITTESTFVVEPIANAASLRAEGADIDVYTIRAANAHGGYGEPVQVTVNATGINTVKSNVNDDTIYNMQGVRVEKAQKGVYIVNGKKVVIK
jgi:pectin methylesterase-like acyl-CoA thioesterase